YSGGTYGADTAQSWCDKTNWMLGKGGLGVNMWDLGQGLPTTANSMMTSIWNVISGANGCVTVASGCAPFTCTPTQTATATPACGAIIDNFESGTTQDNLGGYYTSYN